MEKFLSTQQILTYPGLLLFLLRSKLASFDTIIMQKWEERVTHLTRTSIYTEKACFFNVIFSLLTSMSTAEHHQPSLIAWYWPIGRFSSYISMLPRRHSLSSVRGTYCMIYEQQLLLLTRFSPLHTATLPSKYMEVSIVSDYCLCGDVSAVFVVAPP